MKVYTQAHPQIVLVINDDLAAFEYVRPAEPTNNAIRRAVASIHRASPQCYTRTPSLDYPPSVLPPPPAPPPEK